MPTADLSQMMVDEALNKKGKAVTKKAITQTSNILKKYRDGRKKQIHFDSIDLDFYRDFIDFPTSKDLKQSTIGSHFKNVKVFREKPLKEE